jgi:hypothetical protein
MAKHLPIPENCPAATGVLDVALILEVSELYCLVCPLDRVDAVRKDPFLTLQQAVQVAPHSVRAEFAATYGEALLSIAECLVEDVLLVSSGGSSSSAPAAAPDSRPVTGTSQHRTPETQHNSSTSSSSSSSGRRRPWAGGRNPAVTLVNHRVWWAQDTVSTIGRLMLQDYKDYVVPIDAGESAEPRGEQADPNEALRPWAAGPALSTFYVHMGGSNQLHCHEWWHVVWTCERELKHGCQSLAADEW